MFIKNTSKKIIGIGQVNILPDQEVEISDTLKSNPVIAAYEKLGFAKTYDKTEKATETTADEKKTASKAKQKSNSADDEGNAAE